MFRVPLGLFACAESDVAEQDRLRERAGIIKVARRRRTGLARANSFVVMTDRFFDERFRASEVFELLLRQKNIPIVVRE